MFKRNKERSVAFLEFLKRPFQGDRVDSRDFSGTTLLELLVAIAVTGFVVLLVFAFYTNVIKGYWLNTRKSESVKEMIAVKMKIKRSFNNIETILSCRKEGFDYIKEGTDSVVNVRFVGNALIMNSDTILKKLASFSCQALMQNEKQNATGVLLWEAVIGKGNWLAGAKEVVFNRP